MANLPCACLVEYDPSRRTTKCAFVATHIGLPDEKPCCGDHAYDFERLRDITPLDVARASCEQCAGAEDVDQRTRLQRKKEIRKTIEQAKLARELGQLREEDAKAILEQASAALGLGGAKSAGARWCLAHESEESFAAAKAAATAGLDVVSAASAVAGPAPDKEIESKIERFKRGAITGR